MTWRQVCTAQNKAVTGEKLLSDISEQIEATEDDACIVLCGDEAFQLYILAGIRPPEHIKPNDEIYTIDRKTAHDLCNKLMKSLPSFRQKGFHIV